MLRLLSSKGPRSTRERDSLAARRVDPLQGLARQAARGDVQAQRTVLVTLGPALLRVIRGVLGAHHPDVEDVLQDAMTAVHQVLPSFREECTLLHFGCRVALMTAMNARRRLAHRQRQTPLAAPETIDAVVGEGGRSPAESLAAARRREALRELLCELPTVQAEVLGLHTLLGYSVEETAAATGAPVNTVRSRLRHALAALRARVQGDSALREVLRGAS